MKKILTGMLLCVASNAFAYSGIDDDYSFSMGMAPVFAPIYQGSNDYALSLFPDLRLNYGKTLHLSVQEGIRYNFINTTPLTIGAVTRVRFSREDDGESAFHLSGKTDDLHGLGDVGAAAEVGLYAKVQLVQNFYATTELRQGLGGHHGLIGDFGFKYIHTLAYGFRLSVSPKVEFGSEKYIDTYYGISRKQSIRSGLRQFIADGGVSSYGINLGLFRPIAFGLSLSVFTGYKHLTGDMADSPLVSQRGSNNQFNFGFGLLYKL